MQRAKIRQPGAEQPRARNNTLPRRQSAHKIISDAGLLKTRRLQMHRKFDSIQACAPLVATHAIQIFSPLHAREDERARVVDDHCACIAHHASRGV
jgi:hypothetical protein